MFSANKKQIIGMIHAGALPGTPRNCQTISELVNRAVKEARIYEQAGFDAVMIENMHDRPYLNRSVGPEIVASLTRICAEVKKEITIPIGLQVLAGANKEALAIAQACNLEFIRAEGFVFGHLADEGWMDSDAGELLRFRKQIGAERVQIFTDIKKKHASHKISEDISLKETARAAEYFLSDGLIVTGTSTGVAANVDDVIAVKENSSLPVIIGSGITTDNLETFWNHADGFIVGSSMKYDGNWENEVDKTRVCDFMNTVKKIKS